MHIQKLSIRNILGVQNLQLEAGSFNVVTGRNGLGKTSVLEAIKAVIEGGHDATLLRKGEEAGEVVLVLDDGTRIRKRVTEKSSPLEVVDSEGKKVQRPTDFLKALTDLLAVNPLDFLRAPKKDRVRVLLEAMPIAVDEARLEQISGIPVQAADGANGLAVIDMVYKQVFDDRAGTNRAIKEKDNTINQLKLAMPDPVGGVEGSEDELRAKLQEEDAKKAAELERIAGKLEGIRNENRAKIDQIRDEAQAKIDAIKAEAQAAVDAVQAAERDMEGKAGIMRERAFTAHSEATTPINSALEAIVANRNAAAKREQAQETIRAMEADLKHLQQDLAHQEQALADIAAYRLEQLSKLPIPNVEIKDGEIYRNGVPFDRLNTAQQVDIAVEIAKLRAGDLGVCCVDGIELLDSAAFEEFERRAIESGLQLFVSKVSDQDFQVITSN